DRTSVGHVELLRAWTNECDKAHERCRRQSFANLLPTRVIDVGGPAEIGVQACLVISKGQYGNYVALSHCWGPGSPPLRTTSANIGTMCSGITWESMPQNFQDAVTVTRMLGLRYLWIDSLCILKDSKEDWEREGSRMADIYQNAYITVAATSAKTSHEGLLRYKLLEERDVITFPSPISAEMREDLILYPFGTTSHHQNVERSAWNSRAWTMQERFLSRRIIHYTDFQTIYECRSGNGRVDSELQAQMQADAARAVSTEVHDLYNWWYPMVQGYSSRDLTYPNDLFPALSGLATTMQSISAPYVSDRYLCGLWQEDLARGLLWWSGLKVHASDHDCFPERAPSWSWARCHRGVDYDTFSFSSVEQFRLVDAHIELAGENPFGEVKKARLTV
ncbi:HET-domain-containing protein, partial [Lentithecium fluviatile CBS 122367]